jgi:S1-C subfamily serine protease
MAGWQDNDVITQFDGVTVTTQDELLTRNRYNRADDEVPLTVLRSNSTIEMVPTMGRFQQ